MNQQKQAELFAKTVNQYLVDNVDDIDAEEFIIAVGQTKINGQHISDFDPNYSESMKQLLMKVKRAKYESDSLDLNIEKLRLEKASLAANAEMFKFMSDPNKTDAEILSKANELIEAGGMEAIGMDYLKRVASDKQTLLALNTGLRKSNILELRWEQINFDFNFIEILENKGNKHLLIPLNEKLIQFFNNKPEAERKGYIFINPDTGLPYKDIKKAWSTALEKANIENFRFHDLRHTVGTRLAEQLVPVNVIKELLGHSDVHTTMRY